MCNTAFITEPCPVVMLRCDCCNVYPLMSTVAINSLTPLCQHAADGADTICRLNIHGQAHTKRLLESVCYVPLLSAYFRPLVSRIENVWPLPTDDDCVPYCKCAARSVTMPSNAPYERFWLFQTKDFAGRHCIVCWASFAVDVHARPSRSANLQLPVLLPCSRA